MDSAEQKFFEDLAKFGAGRKNSDYDVELAKAGGATVSAPKIAAKKNDDVFELEPEGQLTIDVYQTPEEIVIESAIAGVKPEDIDVNVTNDSITIRGARHHETRAKEDDYLYQECYWGRFSRSVILPQEVDPDAATVTIRNGILTVRLPKLNRKKTKKLKVKELKSE